MIKCFNQHDQTVLEQFCTIELSNIYKALFFCLTFCPSDLREYTSTEVDGIGDFSRQLVGVASRYLLRGLEISLVYFQKNALDINFADRYKGT